MIRSLLCGTTEEKNHRHKDQSLSKVVTVQITHSERADHLQFNAIQRPLLESFATNRVVDQRNIIGFLLPPVREWLMKTSSNSNGTLCNKTERKTTNSSPINHTAANLLRFFQISTLDVCVSLFVNPDSYTICALAALSWFGARCNESSV